MIRGRAAVTALTVALGLGLAACGATPDAKTPDGRPTSSAPRVPSRAPSTAPSADGRFTMAFAGDVHFTGRTRPLLDDPSTAVGPTAAVLSAADLAMVNLETAITERGVPEPKQYHFRAPASAFAALRGAGIDVTTMANNHALDYGPSGLADTLAAIRATGFPTVGVGTDDAAAWAPWVRTVNGVRVAVLGMSQIRELAPRWRATATRPGIASALDVDRATAAVRRARARADVVVVYLHWGQEGNPCPTQRMKSLARALAAAGADAVVSTHAHLLLGDGYLGRTFVSYGLGNFVWWLDRAKSNDTGVLTLTFTGRRVTAARFTPATITETGQPVPATGSTARRIADAYAGLRACTGLSADPTG